MSKAYKCQTYLRATLIEAETPKRPLPPSSTKRVWEWDYIEMGISYAPGFPQSLINGSLSTPPNTRCQIRSSRYIHYPGIVALIEGKHWNASSVVAGLALRKKKKGCRFRNLGKI